jgi:hypothetical protein
MKPAVSKIPASDDSRCRRLGGLQPRDWPFVGPLGSKCPFLSPFGFAFSVLNESRASFMGHSRSHCSGNAKHVLPVCTCDEISHKVAVSFVSQFQRVASRISFDKAARFPSAIRSERTHQGHGICCSKAVSKVAHRRPARVYLDGGPRPDVAKL